MLDNIILGPICVVTDQDSKNFHLKQLYLQNWLPLMELNKGDLFEDIKSKLVPNEQKNLTSIIVSIGFYKTYQA